MSKESIFRPILDLSEEKLSEIEEQWLEDALELIKQQRMALQMERIQLETRRQQLQDLNVDDIIAERERLANQEGVKESVPPTQPQEEDDSGTTSPLPGMKSTTQGSDQNVKDVSETDDVIPDNDDDLIRDLTGTISNISISGPETSPEPSEKEIVPIETNVSMDANLEPEPKA